MTQNVLGSAQKVPWWYGLTREARLIRRFHALKAAGQTPAIRLKGEQLAAEALEAPARPGGSWKVFQEHREVPVTTATIDKLDWSRSLYND
ncbi:hypothetical protein KC906_03720 [Candidatus Kaiserbacteria bacterium]|nr:hypothetical protein [Candidatus Kaiserbacteria bacterium]MCB9812708.1 hypothetical protein [Candidatus Nomurabacteria bacterium]